MRRTVKEIVIVGLAIVALVYLMMPSLVPDFIPGIGWLDEGVATLILANTLRYYNLDLTNLYKKPQKKMTYVSPQVAMQPGQAQQAPSPVDYEVYEEMGADGQTQYVTRQKT